MTRQEIQAHLIQPFACTHSETRLLPQAPQFSGRTTGL